MDTSYDVIIGHSLGGAVALSLLPLLSNTKETTVILLDPALELTKEIADECENWFLKEIANLRTADDHMAENPAWSRGDSMLRALGISMCDHTVVKRIFKVIVLASKWETLLTSAVNSITGHGLSVACSKTFHPK